MQITTTLDNATFEVTFRDHNYPEMTGDCYWETNRKQIAKLASDSDMSQEFFNDPDEDLTYDPELHDEDDEVTIHSADALICFLAAASQQPKATYTIDYYGVSCWFFHDLCHAEYDSGDGSAVYINEQSEERALPEGAERAARAGVSISEILTELTKAQSEFEGRFGYEFDAVESFLDRVELVLK